MSDLTIYEVRNKLASEFPHQMIVVSESAFYHGPGLDGENYTEFVISISFRFDRFEHRNFAGNSLQECLDKLREAQSQTSFK